MLEAYLVPLLPHLALVFWRVPLICVPHDLLPCSWSFTRQLVSAPVYTFPVLPYSLLLLPDLSCMTLALILTTPLVLLCQSAKFTVYFAFSKPITLNGLKWNFTPETNFPLFALDAASGNIYVTHSRRLFQTIILFEAFHPFNTYWNVFAYTLRAQL